MAGRQAGVKAGDLITDIDGAPGRGLKIDRIIASCGVAANSQVRLKISRTASDDPIELAITRAIIRISGVELQVRIEDGKLVVEETGPWPVLDFEKASQS